MSETIGGRMARMFGRGVSRVALERSPCLYAKGTGKRFHRQRRRTARNTRVAQYVQVQILTYGERHDIDMSKRARDRFAHRVAMAEKKYAA